MKSHQKNKNKNDSSMKMALFIININALIKPIIQIFTQFAIQMLMVTYLNVINLSVSTHIHSLK